MPSGTSSLREMAAQCPDWVCVSCNRCDRRGKLRTARLLDEHGPDLSVPALRRILAADCPRMVEGKFHDICGVFFPGLRG